MKWFWKIADLLKGLAVIGGAFEPAWLAMAGVIICADFHRNDPAVIGKLMDRFRG